MWSSSSTPMTLLLGLYWAVGSNLTLGPTQELTDGAGFSIGHQQMFGIFLSSKLAGAIARKDAKKAATGNRRESVFDKKLEDIELPGWLSMGAGRACNPVLRHYARRLLLR